MFSLCIPTMDRFDQFIVKYLPLYLANEMVSEIIITDENGNDIEKIQNAYPSSSKLKLFKNIKKLGPFLNKLTACSYAQNEWIVLMDSDNFASTEYFEIAQTYINSKIEKKKNIILAPSFAKPSFNYSHLSDVVFKNGQFNNIKNAEIQNKPPSNSPSSTLMNTGNYVINKYLINSLNLSNELNNIQYSSACDVIYFNTLLFEQLDLNLHVVPSLEYTHVVHSGSIYTQTCGNFRDFNKYIHTRYDKLI